MGRIHLSQTREHPLGGRCTWGDAQNWSADTLPTTGDDAVIPDGGIDIVYAGDPLALNSLFSMANLDWTGTLTLNAPSSIFGSFDFSGTLNLQSGATLNAANGEAAGVIQLAANTHFDLLGGVFDALDGLRVQGQGQIVIGTGQRVNLSGNTTTDNIVLGPGGVLEGTGSLHVTQTLNWTGGTIRGTGTVTIDGGGSLSCPGAETRTLENRTLVIAAGASANLTGGQLLMTNATINNAGNFTLSGNNVHISAPGGVNVFNNSGSFSKVQSGLTDVSTVGTRFFNDGGTVSGLTGVLSFSAPYEQSDVNSALITSAEVRALDMSITGGTVQGGGWLWIGDGPLAGQLYLADANLVGPGILYVQPNSTLGIDSFEAIEIDGFHVENRGTARWTAGDILLANDGSIWNRPNAHFLIECHQNIALSEGNGIFHNFGVIHKTQPGPGNTTLLVELDHRSEPNEPPALIDVSGGAVFLSGDGTLAAPVFVAANCSLAFAGGSETLLQQGTVFNGQQGTVAVVGGAVIDIDQGATVTFWTELDIGFALLGPGVIHGPGILEARALVRFIDGTLVNLSLFRSTWLMSIENGVRVDINSSVLRNEGMIHWIDGEIRMHRSAPNPPAVIENRGVFNVAVDRPIRLADEMTSQAEFRNEPGAEVLKSTGLGLTRIEVPFLNSGYVRLEGKNLQFTNSFQQNAGRIELGNGTMTVPALWIHGGLIDLGDNGDGELVVPGGLTIEVDGVLSGLGTVRGNVLNRGLIDIGHLSAPRGSLTIDGDFIQFNSGALLLRLPQAIGMANDFFGVTGGAWLGGALIVENTSGIALAQGNSFTIMAVLDDVSGDFDDYFLPPLPMPRQWQGSVNQQGEFILTVI